QRIDAGSGIILRIIIAQMGLREVASQIIMHGVQFALNQVQFDQTRCLITITPLAEDLAEDARELMPGLELTK
ncbi:hypothetical protein, partial [Pseudomonas syringae group genomosp. 7]|uniref:hypothetical protein n=1 Tax=Pseudomonas syringae group genomosp. 7 TaxID=251699 RepID=UPI003770469D